MGLLGQLTAWLSLFSLALASGENDGVLHSEIGRLNNQSLLWGPYRPNLYFGVRPRLPLGIATALSWVRVDNYVDVQGSM
jgi:mannosyl-oligosaccharide glucosidase